MEEMERLVLEITTRNKINAKNLRELLKVTLARIMTFNACRGGEVSRLKLEHWVSVESDVWKRKSDIAMLDDPVEKKLAERLKLCYIEDKKKKKGKDALVPILFTDEVTEAIRLLLKHRNKLELPSDNNYVFGSGDLFLRGWDTLQDITKKIANLIKPNLITATRTRKYLATMLQLLDMNDSELTWLTNHFGHTKNVHFAWYRKEDATIELTKIAKVLTAVDAGENVKNKKIDSLGGEGGEEERLVGDDINGENINAANGDNTNNADNSKSK